MLTSNYSVSTSGCEDTKQGHIVKHHYFVLLQLVCVRQHVPISAKACELRIGLSPTHATLNMTLSSAERVCAYVSLCLWVDVSDPCGGHIDLTCSGFEQLTPTCFLHQLLYAVMEKLSLKSFSVVAFVLF